MLRLDRLLVCNNGRTPDPVNRRYNAHCSAIMGHHTQAIWSINSVRVINSPTHKDSVKIPPLDSFSTLFFIEEAIEVEAGKEQGV